MEEYKVICVKMIIVVWVNDGGGRELKSKENYRGF